MPRLGLAAFALTLLLPTTMARATPNHQWSQLPAGAREVNRDVAGTRANVRVVLPRALLQRGYLTEATAEALHRLYLDHIGAVRSGSDDLAPLPQSVRDVAIAVALADQPRAFRPLSAWLAEIMPVPKRDWELPLPSAAAGSGALTGVSQSGEPKGALTGKTVYLSPGHGFTWTQNLAAWATQRGNTHNLVEDLLNAEAALHYLVPLLRNAGARVVTVRERDLNSAQVVVDDGLGASGGYSESGAAFAAGINPGYGGLPPWTEAQNPFALASYRTTLAVVGAATAHAHYVPNLPTTGSYAVYLGSVAGANRVPDAHVEIRHLGGVSHVRVDQTKHGGTWVYLGHYVFAAGSDPSKGAVVLHNDTLAGFANRYLIADVVRFGGGMGDVARGPTPGKPPAKGPVSTRPRWEESCRTYAQFAGAPPTVYDNSGDDPSDDVSCRSRLAAWDHEDGEDAVYLSWHTNAPSPARGTSTYVYGINPPDGTYQFSGSAGSDVFGKLVHKAVVADIKALWDPNWKDRGVYTAYFGEINPKHNNEMPATLVEAAFHSTAEDADALREPRFRHLLARAMYKGIVQFFAQKDAKPVQLLPESPQALSAVVQPDGAILVRWLPGATGPAMGDAATSFRVQVSGDGLGFADGDETPLQQWVVPGSNVGAPLWVRVVAVNAGGTSLPSLVVGAVRACAGAKRALVVEGFERLQASQAPNDNLGAFNLATVQRLRQRKMNTFDYSVLHVQALAVVGMQVDTVQRDAVTAALLANHELVHWAAGEQAQTGGVVNADQRKLLTDWLQAAPQRALWLDGSEVAYTLGGKGSPADADWLATWFGAGYLSDDAGGYALSGASVAGNWTFDDGSQHSYDVDFADVLAISGGTAVLQYTAGAGVAAVTRHIGESKTLLSAVPLETVYPQTARHELVAKLVQATLGGPGTCGGPIGADAGPSPDGAPDTSPQADAAVAEAAAVDAGQALDAVSPDATSLETQTDAAARDVASGPRPSADSGCRSGPAEVGTSWWVLLALGWAVCAQRRRSPPSITTAR